MSFEKEKWLPVVGYESLYEVSNFGNVRRLPTIQINSRGIKRKLKGHIVPIYKKARYLYCDLTNNGITKHYRVHILVAKSFIPNPNDLPEVNHKDENKLNNNVDNLEWCDRIYNANYGNATKKIAKALGKPVLQYDLFGNLKNEYPSISECCRINGYNMSFISNCCNGKYKRAYGFIWKFKKLENENEL